MGQDATGAEAVIGTASVAGELPPASDRVPDHEGETDGIDRDVGEQQQACVVDSVVVVHDDLEDVSSGRPEPEDRRRDDDRDLAGQGGVLPVRDERDHCDAQTAERELELERALRPSDGLRGEVAEEARPGCAECPAAMCRMPVRKPTGA
jgi:hypothetical protein